MCNMGKDKDRGLHYKEQGGICGEMRCLGFTDYPVTETDIWFYFAAVFPNSVL